MSKRAPAISRIICLFGTVAFLMSLVTPVMGQGQGGAYVVWNPLWPTPQYDRLEWTLTVLDLPIEHS